MKEEKEKLKTLIGINQYLDEKSDYIFNTMENNKSILINSKMKTGKTTFITKNVKYSLLIEVGASFNPV